MTGPSIDDLQAMSDRVAEDASQSLQAIGGQDHAERVLTMFLFSYCRALTSLLGPRASAALLYGLADGLATGEA